VPAKGGEQSYALLREAMRETGRVGIGKFILREAQHLAAVEVIENALVLTVMRFADELVDVKQFTFPPASGLRKPELGMAVSIVNSLASEWKPEKYTDEYRDNLMRLIQAKIKGREVTFEADDDRRPAEVVDLMERLRKSLEQSGGKSGRTRTRQKPRATKTTKTTRGRKKHAA
jgi:DNA end-binding protein Ku